MKNGQRLSDGKKTKTVAQSLSGRAWILVLVLVLLGVAISSAQSQTQDGYSVVLRSIDAADLGIAHPTGLTYSASAGVFMAVGAPGAADIVTFDPFENPTGCLLYTSPSPRD